MANYKISTLHPDW